MAMVMDSPESESESLSRRINSITIGVQDTSAGPVEYYVDPPSSAAPNVIRRSMTTDSKRRKPTLTSQSPRLSEDQRSVLFSRDPGTGRTTRSSIRYGGSQSMQTAYSQRTMELEETLKYMTPRPAGLRYMMTDSPPNMSPIIGREDLPLPEMYVTQWAAADIPRHRKKRRLMRDMGTIAIDDNFEAHGYLPNVSRGPYRSMGREVLQDRRKKKATPGSKKKIVQDASHTCIIEVDDSGCLQTVILTDDLGHTDLRFGKQNILFEPAQQLHDADVYSVPKNKSHNFNIAMKYHTAQAEQAHPIGYTEILLPEEIPVEQRIRSARSNPYLDYKSIGKASEIHNIMTPAHAVGDVPFAASSLIEPARATAQALDTGTQVSIMPEHETDEYYHPGMAGRRAYNTQELSSSSEDEGEYTMDAVRNDKEIPADAVWRRQLQKETRKVHETICYGTKEQVEDLKRSDSRINYEGGRTEYRRRRSTIENKGYSLPSDMRLVTQ